MRLLIGNAPKKRQQVVIRGLLANAGCGVVSDGGDLPTGYRGGPGVSSVSARARSETRLSSSGTAPIYG